MSFLRAARAALSRQSCVLRILASVSVVVVSAGFLLSCASSYKGTGEGHNAYVALQGTGNIQLLHIDGGSGTITLGAATPQVLDTSPNGLALLSNKFLYAVNSFANSISIFSIASDGTLALNATPTLTGGSGPYAAVIDPSGKYLLVTNSLTDNVSVFSIDAGTGALTLTGPPVFANASPTEILMMPSGNVVYVSNPGIGAVSTFSFSNGVLTQIVDSPVFSGAGATGLAVNAGGKFLYVANTSARNPPPYTVTTGNISGFSIDPTTGGLTPLLSSPFAAVGGSGPTQLAIDPSGQFLYSSTPGTADSIWCFTINSTTGQLTAVPNSPFSLAAGSTFASFDPTGGHFYLGNSANSVIEGYAYNPSTGALTAITGSPFALATSPGKMVFSQ